MQPQPHALPQSLQNLSDDSTLAAATRHNAAIRIQKAWRRKMRKKYLGPDFLWTDLAIHARMKVDRNAAEQGKNTSKARWRRGVFLAGRLKDGPDMLSYGQQPKVEPTSSVADRKHLETQHWLELIDGKHRYGSNLKFYHARWKQEDTTENFFKWLDYGGGKNLSLKDCPREQLEKERITYLSPEQRLNYLATIDNDGRLRWAMTGQLVDTTAGHWKDAGRGRGIVPMEHPEPGPVEERHSFVVPSPDTSSLSGSLSGSDEDAIMHYAGLEQPKNPIKRILWKNFTIRGIVQKMLRKTVKRNTWIYVSDRNFNIFIGIKKAGTFQHSSFLAGGLVTSAGLISVKDGIIHTLSPLSGHYRTSVGPFKRFLAVLEERGVDMRKVKVSKAEFALWGIEHVKKYEKKQKQMVKDGKRKVEDVAVRVADKVSPHSAKEENWKQEILEGRRRREEDRPVSIHEERSTEPEAGSSEQGATSPVSPDDGAGDGKGKGIEGRSPAVKSGESNEKDIAT